jgi:hypothetical protein
MEHLKLLTHFCMIYRLFEPSNTIIACPYNCYNWKNCPIIKDNVSCHNRQTECWEMWSKENQQLRVK